MSCSGGKAWYACSKGPFQGCCSIDPCNTGICPDDDNDGTHSTDKSKPTPAIPATPSGVSTTFTTSITSTTSVLSTKATGSSTTTTSRSASTPTETSTGVAESISISTSTSILASSPLSPNSLSTEDSPSTTQTSTGLSTVLPTSSHTNSSGDKPNTGLIAGIAAGVAAALILLGLLFSLIRRSRKKRSQRFTLLRWHGPMHECNENASSPTVLHNLLTSANSCSHDSDNSPSRPRAAASRNSSVAGPGTETLVSLASHTNSHSISSNPGIILTPPSSTTLSTPSITLLTDPATSPTAALAISQNKNNGTSTSTRTKTHSQRQLEPTPELSDTGFYRQRAELADHSARELINVPLSQRLRPHHHRQSPRQSRASSTLSPNLRPPPAIPIVTADGVVLTSNLDQLAKDSSPRSAPGSDEDHVMSFMRYDAAKDAILPAYQASLGRSSTRSANATGNENVSAWEEKERREVRH